MATRDSHALLSHWNQEKSGGGRWKEGARLGPRATTYKGALVQRSLRSKVGTTHDGGRAFRQAEMTRVIAGERETTNMSRKVSRMAEIIPLIPANSSD